MEPLGPNDLHNLIAAKLCLNQPKLGVNDLPQPSGAVAGAPACHSIWSDVYTHRFTARSPIFAKWEMLLDLSSVLYLRATFCLLQLDKN